MERAGHLVWLTGLGTALPPHELPQSSVKVSAKRRFDPWHTDFDRVSRSFLTAGIDKRYSVVPLEWFDKDHGWTERTKRYLEGSTELFVAATERALTAAQLNATDIDIVVTVSSTGIATPTLEALAFQKIGFRSDVHRVPVFGLGCSGGVTGLALAARLARAQAGTRVLMVAVETCTLRFRGSRATKADIIASILFGDGAAAACLTSGETTPDAGFTGNAIQVGQGYEYLWPDTLGIMGWDVDEDGLGVVFDRSIPHFTEAHLLEAVEAGLTAAELDRTDIARFVFHPGGAKVIAAIEKALALNDGELDHERSVLRDFGNMSAPTALFVLERAISGGTTGQLVLGALGPGFTASLLPLHVSRDENS